MRNATINLDYYQLPAEQHPAVKMSTFLLEQADDAKYFTALKSELLEIFTTYFHSETFKTREDDTYLSYLLFSELNDMFDNIYLAQIECKNLVVSNKINNFKENLTDRVTEEMALEKRLKELRGTDSPV
jgi:hypothetical protein